MKKPVAAVAALVVAGAAAAVVAVGSATPEICYVRKPGPPVAGKVCECQGNEQVKNRSPRNVKNFPEWGDCGAVPRPAKFMRGDNCIPVPGPCQ